MLEFSLPVNETKRGKDEADNVHSCPKRVWPGYFGPILCVRSVTLSNKSANYFIEHWVRRKSPISLRLKIGDSVVEDRCAAPACA